MKTQRKEDSCPPICGDWGKSMADFTDKHRCCVGCLLKILVIIFFVFIVASFSIKMGFVDSFWNTLSCFANQVTNTRDSSIAWASWLTALATIGAFIFAWLAYRQSLRARKSAAFYSVFSQLISSHKSIFGQAALQGKLSSHDNHSDRTSEESVDAFAAFYSFFEDNYKNLLDEKSSDKGVSIVTIWDRYIRELRNSPKFSHCFKYAYHEIWTVINERTISEKEKKEYISIIQGCMNCDELFCYLINLLQHYHHRRDYNGFKNALRKYKFFKDLLHSRERNYLFIINELRRSTERANLEEIIGKDDE